MFLQFFKISGVCNTDNFSLLSITIDYGPFGFMEAYNPGIYDVFKCALFYRFIFDKLIANAEMGL